MPTVVVPSSAFVLAGGIGVSEDAWEGDAEVTVDVNGGGAEGHAIHDNTGAVAHGDCTAVLAIAGANPPASSPAETVTFNLSEDVWEATGDFVVHIDGIAVTTPRPVTAPAKCRRNPRLHLHD